MMRLRYTFVLFAAITFPFIEGCNTYVQQKADVLSGGPERRVRDAQERQQAAEDTQHGLQSDQEALAEERALQEEEWTALNRRLKAQETQIARARAENRITRAKEQEMRETIRALDRDVQDMELRLQAARLSGDVHQEEALRKQLQELDKKVSALGEEIDLLAE